jgi:hypothetical protein
MGGSLSGCATYTNAAARSGASTLDANLVDLANRASYSEVEEEEEDVEDVDDDDDDDDVEDVEDDDIFSQMLISTMAFVFGSCLLVPPVAAMCGLYMARVGDSVGLFSGIVRAPHSEIGTELFAPFVRPNKNEWSAWHDFARSLRSDSDSDGVFERRAELAKQLFVDDDDASLQDVFVSGIGAMVLCSDTPNVAPGSHSNDSTIVFRAGPQGIDKGAALTVKCGEQTQPAGAALLSIEELEGGGGVCVDSLVVRDSKATARVQVAAGDVVAVSPVIAFDRSQLDVVQQTRNHKPPFRAITFNASEVTGRQPVAEHCWLTPASNVVLLPTAPGVLFVGRNGQANVRLHWSHALRDSTSSRQTSPIELLLADARAHFMTIEFVALRAIAAGDEIVAEAPSKDFWPSAWIDDNATPQGDFIDTPLMPGQLEAVRWRESGQVVTPWALRVRMHENVRHVLLDFCNRMGITDVLRRVTVEGNALEPDSGANIDVHGQLWHLQRPDARWRSNMHWLSPGAVEAHETYLQALSAAGFDQVLRDIGEQLGMDGLVAFHLTFIAVSRSAHSLLHHDVMELPGKAFNVIVPLLLAGDAGPELDLRGSDLKVGRYQYALDEGIMLGDAAIHATSACDYWRKRDMRMAATIYIADVNDTNAASVIKLYTQAYPPRDDIELLKSWAGLHWRKGDPSRKLPPPQRDHVLLSDRTAIRDEL